jgi:predicted dithiol-disulfide oxidoreductase (DUF899 family)
VLAQPPEAPFPEPVDAHEPGLYLAEPVPFQAVVALAAGAPLGDDADAPHQPQVLGHGGPADGQRHGEVGHALVAAGEALEQLPADGVSEDPEYVVDRGRTGGGHLAIIREENLTCLPGRDDADRRGDAMAEHKIGTREEWLAAREQLLVREKEHTRLGDELARRRQELPWVRIDKEYRFETDEGSASLADLFRGRSQLLVYHFMFGPDYTAGCPACSAIADGFEGFTVHLANHDVTLCAVSRAPLAKLNAYKRRMGWSFPWASSFDSDFNYDFQVSQTEEQQLAGGGEYNFRPMEATPPETGKEGPLAEWAAMVGTDWLTYTRERPGMSAFAVEDGIVYHTYSAYARGLDGLWGMYQWLDRAPRGRNEENIAVNWFRRHDEYDRE